MILQTPFLQKEGEVRCEWSMLRGEFIGVESVDGISISTHGRHGSFVSVLLDMVSFPQPAMEFSADLESD